MYILFLYLRIFGFFFFSSRRRHTILVGDWSSDVCSSDLGIWPRDVLKKVSRGLSRVEAGHPGVPRLVQVTSGGFSWWLGEARETGGGRGLSGLHWAWCIGRGPHLQLRQEPQGTSDFRLRSQGPCRLGTGESGLVLG